MSDLSVPEVISFVAPTSNTGRTSIVANLAHALSSSGKRVLVLDWGTEGALVHDYLRPFLTDELHIQDALGIDVGSVLDRLTGGASASPRLRRYAAGPGRLDVVGVAPIDARRIRLDDPPDIDGIDRLRALLPDMAYDYVLVDGPSAQVDDAGLEETARLCDQVVVCFTPQSNLINSAARLAADIRNKALIGLRTVVVACQFTDDDRARADRILGDIRRRFADFLTGTSAAPLIRVPLRPYDEVLATVLEDPDSDSRLLTAYRELTRAVTADAITTLPVNPFTLRRRYRAALSPETTKLQEQILLACAPADRWWAEVVRDQLVPNGIRVDWLAASGSTRALAARALVLVASPNWERSPAAAAVRAILARRGGGAAEPRPHEVVVVRLKGGAVPDGIGPVTVVDLTDELTAEIVAGRLFGALGIRAVAQMAALPGRPPAASEPLGRPAANINLLPSRDRSYFGRHDELSSLRDRLLGRDATAVVLIRGESGVGKTALVREYVHWFTRDYDTVWWISAHDRHSVHETVMALGERIGVSFEGDLVAATLRGLADARGAAGRWLLVYDGADDLAELAGAVPTGGPGHVIITTRMVDATPLDLPAQLSPSTVTVEPFDLGPIRREEAVEGLCQLVRAGTDDKSLALSDEQAGRLVDAIGRLPITLTMAAAYLVEKATRARSTIDPQGLDDPAQVALDRAISALLPIPAGSSPLTHVVSAVIALLEQDEYGLCGLHLAELCTFLAPDGADLKLLRSHSMLSHCTDAANLPRAGVTEDDIDRILWIAARYGLLSVQWSAPEPVRVVIAPVLRSVLQDRMAPEERARRRSQAQHGLAGYARSTPTMSHAGAELQRHLLPSGALLSAEEDVREWVVRQLRDLVNTRESAKLWYAAPLIQETLDRWRAGAAGTDRLTLYLAIQRTNLHRILGEARQALDLDEAMHELFAPLFGRDHLLVLVLRRGIAGSMRALGQFAEALALDQATWRMFVDTHGEDHPNTLTSAHNLAVSWFLSGSVERALHQEQEVYERRVRLFGADGVPALWSATDIGIYERELGRYPDAVGRLTATERRLKERLPDSTHLHRLRVRRHLAIARRLAGDPRATPETTAQVAAVYENTLGENHPYTWAARLSSAVDHFAAGNVDEAIHRAKASLAFHLETLGEDHPFTAACRVNLAMFHAGAGHEDQARVYSQSAVDGLTAMLGEPHPWTIAALTNHAGVLATGGHAQATEEAAELARSLCLEFLGREHPYTGIANGYRTISTPIRFIDLTIPET